MKKNCLKIVAGVFFIWLAGGHFCRQAVAFPYFKDGFNYTAPSELGNNPPWVNPLATIVVTNGNLTYSNLLPVSPGANMVLVSSNSTSIYSYAQLSTTATNGSVYLSFLIKYNVFSGSFTRAGLLQSTNISTAGLLTTTNDPLDFVDEAVTGGFKFGIRAKDGSSYYVTNAYSPLQVGTTYLVVIKFKFSDGSASMWVNPPIGGAEPTSPDATSLPNAGIVTDLKYLYLRAGSAAPGFLVDNIQVGSTWQDVTATPGSPASLIVTLPGQTYVTGSGVSGNPVSEIAGTAFNIGLTAVESDGVTVATNYSGVKTLSYSGPFGTVSYTTSVTFTNGQAANIPVTISSPQAATLTATDGTLAGIASSGLSVYPTQELLTLYDFGHGLFGGENLGITNVPGLDFYVWSSTNATLSVSNWYEEGLMQEHTLAPGLTNASRYTINVSPTVSPTYYIVGSANTGPYLTSPVPAGTLTTADFSTFNLAETNVAISASGVLSLGSVSPPILISSGIVSGGNFQFQYNAAIGQNYTIQASTNLINWTNLSSGTITNSTQTFTDTATASYRVRFYRVVLP